jgi:hypothetical protein
MKLFLAMLISVSMMSLNAFATSNGDIATTSLSSTGLIVLSVYAPEVAAGLVGTTAFVSLGELSLMTSVSKALESNQKIKNAINSDAQHFYQNGKMSLALKQSVDQLKKMDRTMSDSEAVDAIVDSVNN